MRKRELKGTVAIVTGASSGIGWQTAVRLAERGVRICATARRRDALELLRSQIVGAGNECLVAPGDVTDPEDVERVVAETLRHYGRLDMLVNDAAVQSYGNFEDLDWSEIERVFEVTCFGYMRFARAVLPHFRRQGTGHIVNVLSMLSVGAAPLLSAYTAAKHALFGWAECLRLELYETDIAVSGVLAPSVATPMFDHAPTKLDRAPRPVPPTYDPDVVAKAVVRCAERPQSENVPVFLQGNLILFLQDWAPFVGDFVLGKWGRRMQTRKTPIERPKGNLYEPMSEGVGPYGSIPATPAWIRYGATAAILAGAGSAAVGALVLGRRVLRAAGQLGS